MPGCKYWWTQEDGFHGWCKHPEAQSGTPCILNTEEECVLREVPEGEEAARERLFFEPLRGVWRWEKISEDDRILDYFELIPSGVVSRYSKDEIAAALRKAADELERAR